MRGQFLVLALAFAMTQANQVHSDSEGATMAKDKMMPPMDKMMKEGGGAKESGAQDLERAASASYIHGHPKLAAGGHGYRHQKDHYEEDPYKLGHFPEDSHRTKPYSKDVHTHYEEPFKPHPYKKNQLKADPYKKEHYKKKQEPQKKIYHDAPFQKLPFHIPYPHNHQEAYHKESYHNGPYKGGPYQEDDDDNYILNEHDLVSLHDLKAVLVDIFESHLAKYVQCPQTPYTGEPRHYKSPPSAPAKCEPSQWSKCTCKSPAEFSVDGRGNCNLGATKSETKVWCYVEDKLGDPAYICPDSKPSNSKPGYYWSRYACIT